MAGCGKYEEGPFLSLRSKNARIDGKWNLVGYEAKYVDSASPEDNESYSFKDGTMTYQFNDVTFDPFTGDLIITPATSTYAYALSFEFDKRDNVFTSVETSSGTTQTDESYWTWQDGAKSQEMIEIDGQVFVIKKLTNKEMILYLDFSATGSGETANYTWELTFEK
jgi:hypothetical protein